MARDFLLDATVVAAFQRTKRLAVLRSLSLPLLLVDVVHIELAGNPHDAPNEHQAAIRAAVGEGWLRVEPLPALGSPVAALMSDAKLGLRLHEGEAASIALCLRRPELVFVTSDKAGFAAGAKHLHGPHTRAVSLYGFLRELVETHGLSVEDARALINYADCGGALRPVWWDGWLLDPKPTS